MADVEDNMSSQGRAALPQVLYLDFDGVLHHDAVFRHPTGGIYLDTEIAPGRCLFEWAEHLVQAIQPFPKLEIVLSTSWVRVVGFTRARDQLPPELRSRVSGATFPPYFHSGDAVQSEGIYQLERGVEVMQDVCQRRPHEWIAIDDCAEGWPVEHRDRVVLCDPTVGLSDADTRSRLQAALTHYFTSDAEFEPLTPQEHALIASAEPCTRGAVVSSLLESCASSACDFDFAAALTVVAQRGLASAGLAVVKTVAKGVWHGHHVPQKGVFQGPYEEEAALLIERLAIYAIVPQPRKKALLSLVRLLLPADESASRTVFNSEFKRYLPELQPLQTRHHPSI